MATHIVVNQTLGGYVNSMTDLLFGVVKVFFDVGIAVHDQSPDNRVATGQCK